MSEQLLTAGATERGWVAPAQMTYDEWRTIGATMQQLSRYIPMWLGDWLNEGERRYGETYTEAILFTDRSIEQLQQYKWVMGKVPISVRQDNLTFTHYRLVAKLPEDEQAHWLAIAHKNELSTEELRQLIQPAMTPSTPKPTAHSTPERMAEWINETFSREWIAELKGYLE